MDTLSVLCPESSMIEENPTIEFSFPCALVGNRLHLLNASISHNVDEFYTVLFYTPLDLSQLFLAEIKADIAQEWISVFDELSTSTDTDNKFIPLRIDITDEEITLACNFKNYTLRHALRKPSAQELTDHLFSILNRERAMLIEERSTRESLEQKIVSAEMELSSMKQKAAWLEKEMEVLKLLLKASSGLSPDKSHCESCNCPNRDAALDSNGTPSDDTTTLEGASEQDDGTDSIFKALKQEIPSETPSQQESPSGTQQPQNLLLGIAQYILCQLCPEQTPDIKDMEDHFFRAHVNKEKRNCEACPSEDKPDLFKHMRIHTNKIYACEYCGKRGRRNYLKAHLRVHTGERPFTCETCKRSFSDGSTLRRHRLVHSGEKKHTCPICGRGIARKDNVKSHIRSHGVRC